MGITIKDIKKIQENEPQNQKAKKTNATKNEQFLKNILKKELNNKLSDKQKEFFFSELHILLSSGLDIGSSFKIILSQKSSKKLKQQFEGIYKKIIKGESLSESIVKTNSFSDYDYYSLKIGEESGNISQILNELGKFYSKKVALKRMLINALTYPIIVLVTAVGAVIFMLNFIVPLFVDIFKRSNSELPGITKSIINISNGFWNNLPWMIIFVIAIICAMIFFRKKENYKKITSAVYLRLPIFGSILKLVYLQRFFLSMILLLKSKVSIINAIDLITKMIGFYPVEKSLEIVKQDVVKGKLLYQSMEKFSIFDDRITSLIKVGEEVNKLDEIFEKLNSIYSDRLDYQMGTLSNLLEPILIVFIGLFVGIILVAMYLPMFQMGTSIL